LKQTNFITGGPLAAEGPGQLPPLPPPLIRPCSVQCRTEADSTLSRSVETCKMLKVIISKQRFIKISESVTPHQILFQHQLGYQAMYKI